MHLRIDSLVRMSATRAIILGAVLLAILAAGSKADRASAATILVPNHSFEATGPFGTFTSTTSIAFAQQSAASNWLVWNNTYGTTTTDILNTTLYGGGYKMLHVTTEGHNNGLSQQWSTPITGACAARFAVWVFVVRGQVGVGLGRDGNTVTTAFTTTTGRWELLQGGGTIGPVAQLIIYAAANGMTDFYVDTMSVTC